MVLTKWSTTMTKKFILLYKEQECLWKVDDPAYRDGDARDAALTFLMKCINLRGLDLDDVKRKIKYLRSTYINEINKMEKALLSGQSYKPRLAWFNEMDSFVRSQIRKNSCNRLTVKNDPENTSHEDSQEDSEPEHPIETGRTVASWHQNSDKQQQNRQPFNNDPTYRTPDIQEDPLGLLSEGDMEQASPSSKRQRVEQQHSPITQDTKTYEHRAREDDEFDIFGKHVAMQLKSLLEEDAIMAQDEIQAILTRYRLKKLRRKNLCNNECFETKTEIL